MTDPDHWPTPMTAPDCRRRRIVAWLLAHPELDDPATKGRIVFNLGRQAGTGLPAVSATFEPTPVELT